MHANETRVSQPLRHAEGGADSHKNPITSPEAAAPVEMSLTDAQLSTFWARIVANLDDAQSVAAGIVSEKSADDIVHTAALLFVENAQRSKKPEPFPANEERFRRTFLRIVVNHARDCVRDSKRPARPVHSHWGIDPELAVNGRNVADRELDTVFARNDEGKYDAPAPTVGRAHGDLDGLHYILHSHMRELSQTQREIIVETYFEGQSREEIAARRGISLSTYDNHRKAACQKLRDSLTAVADFSTEIDLPDWFDRVGEMSKRRAARQQRRASRKKEKSSSSKGDRSSVEHDHSSSRGDADRNAPAADESVATAA